MADPRCTCAMDDCPICNAPEHRPWQPKAGSPFVGPVDPMAAASMAEYEAQLRRWERWQSIRRYLLVMLLATLGGMIGGMASALTLIWHFN